MLIATIIFVIKSGFPFAVKKLKSFEKLWKKYWIKRERCNEHKTLCKKTCTKIKLLGDEHGLVIRSWKLLSSSWRMFVSFCNQLKTTKLIIRKIYVLLQFIFTFLWNIELEKMFISQNTYGEFLITFKVTALFLLKIELAKNYQPSLLNYVVYNLMYS